MANKKTDFLKPFPISIISVFQPRNEHNEPTDEIRDQPFDSISSTSLLMTRIYTNSFPGKKKKNPSSKKLENLLINKSQDKRKTISGRSKNLRVLNRNCYFFEP